MSRRRKYTKEFKMDTICLVTEQSYTCAEASRSLDINSNILSRWIHEATENKETVLGKKNAKSSQFTYGTRRIKKGLNAMGHPVGRRKTRSLMQEAQVFIRYRNKYKVTTNSGHKQPVFENVLNRNFQVTEPDRAYVSYLTVMVDLFSRKVVGRNMSSRMKSDVVCNALTMATWLRRPKAGLIVHSDRGSQYASNQYRNLLKKHDFVGSMSRKGDCWNNSVAESFFARLKEERVHWRNYQTRQEAKQDILNYITMFYNSHRFHLSLEYMSPNQFEKKYRDLIRKVA